MKRVALILTAIVIVAFPLFSQNVNTSDPFSCRHPVYSKSSEGYCEYSTNLEDTYEILSSLPYDI